MQSIFETVKACRRETGGDPERLALHPDVHRDVLAQMRGAGPGDRLQV